MGGIVGSLSIFDMSIYGYSVIVCYASCGSVVGRLQTGVVSNGRMLTIYKLPDWFNGWQLYIMATVTE